MLKELRVGVTWLAVVGSIMAAGCKDEPVAPGLGGLPPEVLGLDAGIHPVLSVPGLDLGAPERVTRVRLYLLEVGQDNPLASYQGVLHYDPEALQVLDASFGTGLLGAWNLVEPGLIRFAGVAPDGLKGVAALDLSVRATRQPIAQDFQVALEEVIGSKDFVNLTGRVSRTSSPVITAGAMERLKR